MSVAKSQRNFLRSLRTGIVLLGLLTLLSSFAAAQADVIRRTYVWSYSGKTWSFSYDFPANLYQFQKSLPRTLDYTAYAAYVDDPREQTVLQDFVTKLEASALGLPLWDRLNLVIALVQSIPYAEEPCEYPRYPIEMLVDQQGDCEDSAILAAALVRKLGFDAVLLAFLEEHHMAIGIRVLPPALQDSQFYAWNGDLYYYLEPTSPGWAIGQVPPAYQSVPTIIGLSSLYATP